MNKAQAINILTNLANLAQKNGLIEDIMTAGSVYTALVILAQDIQVETVEQVEESGVDESTSQEEN